ncbi:MAG: hypothetical protein BGO13_10915 [Burkholderiales bacterium 66-5]|nr:MAG: hypothetical protein BGO13_10915 [Burkholderiales bacterium 66-5]
MLTRWTIRIFDAQAINPSFIRIAIVRDACTALFVLAFGAGIYLAANAIRMTFFVCFAFRDTLTADNLMRRRTSATIPGFT